MEPTDASFYRSTLEKSAIFRNLPPAALEQVLKKGMLLEARKDDTVFFENMRGGFGLYVVLEGKLEVFKAADTPAQGDAAPGHLHLNTLGPGQSMGEYSLIDGLMTSAAARALEPTWLFYLPRTVFDEIVGSDAEVGRAIYRNLVHFLVERLRKKG